MYILTKNSFNYKDLKDVVDLRKRIIYNKFVCY